MNLPSIMLPGSYTSRLPIGACVLLPITSCVTPGSVRTKLTKKEANWLGNLISNRKHFMLEVGKMDEPHLRTEIFAVRCCARLGDWQCHNRINYQMPLLNLTQGDQRIFIKFGLSLYKATTVRLCRETLERGTL